jgi:hypothetical protein
MRKNKLTTDEREVASMRKDINDDLGTDYYCRMQALDNIFTELRLGTPEQDSTNSWRML